MRHVAVTLMLVAAGCDLGEIAVPPQAEQLVVHAVLNVSAGAQEVLLERTRAGHVSIPEDQQYSSADPIVSGGGIPELNATVDLVTPSGLVLRAAPVNVAGGPAGSGVYRFPGLSGTSLLPGGRYALRVATTRGEQLSAETVVPNTRGTSSVVLRPMNRARDTVVISWAPVAASRAYSIRIETPFGPMIFFTDTTVLRLAGDLRNLFQGNIPRAFIPGFRQQVVVTAVDANFFDYVRTFNDPYTGSGILTRVQGGMGFFGSAVNVSISLLTVTEPQEDAVEGAYRLLDTPQHFVTSPVGALSLYVESEPAKVGAPRALSGSHGSLDGSNQRVVGGFLGAQQADTMRLIFFQGQRANDTLAVWSGVRRGDTLDGRFSHSDRRARFLRSP